MSTHTTVSKPGDEQTLAAMKKSAQSIMPVLQKAMFAALVELGEDTKNLSIFSDAPYPLRAQAQ